MHSTRIKRSLEEHSKGLADRLAMRSEAERSAKMSLWHPCVAFRDVRIRPHLEMKILSLLLDKLNFKCL